MTELNLDCILNWLTINVDGIMPHIYIVLLDEKVIPYKIMLVTNITLVDSGSLQIVCHISLSQVSFRYRNPYDDHYQICDHYQIWSNYSWVWLVGWLWWLAVRKHDLAMISLWLATWCIYHIWSWCCEVAGCLAWYWCWLSCDSYVGTFGNIWV